MDGLKAIGQGSDPLSKALTHGTQNAVTMSMDQFPKETRAVLNFMAATGQAVDATLSFVDSKTNKVVSSNWNSLSPDTRSVLIGTGKVVSVVLTPVGVGQVKTAITAAPKAITEQAKTIAMQNMIRDAGAIDALTGKPKLDLKEWTKVPGSPHNHSLKEATGDLFGSNAMQTLFKDAQWVGGVKLGDQGLDAVYKVNHPDVDFLFVEYKFNKSKQGLTNDGLQGSSGWVTGSNRIENAVGDKLAPSVRVSREAGRTETILIQTLPDGRTNVKLLDVNGKVVPITQSRVELVQRISSNLNKGLRP